MPQHFPGCAIGLALCAIASGCTSQSKLADMQSADRMLDEGGTAPDGSGAVGGSGRPSATAIAPPQPDDCIGDVSPGDHSYHCGGQTFLVMVDEQCTRTACGLILDVHGAAMSGEAMRNNTQLHELAPGQGYLVVHPSAQDGVWDLETDPPIIAEFIARMIAVFHVDKKRIHVTGFSMGSAITFWFLCNRSELLASAGPVTGSSADEVTLVDSDESCLASIDQGWQPKVPILFMSGTRDEALPISAARARTDGLVARLSLSGGEVIEGDDNFTRRRWRGDDAMILDFIEHDYENALLAGHCIPGGPASDVLIACDTPEDGLHWGRTVLQWFEEHPKR